MWAPEQNWAKVRRETGRWMEVMLLGAGCPGSLSVDELEELRMEKANSGQNLGDFVDGNWGKDGGKLDLPATHEIRRSNPTNFHHTDKSQKNLGGYFCGEFLD